MIMWISLTIMPLCKVHQASDVATNYWKDIVLYYNNNEEDIILMGLDNLQASERASHARQTCEALG